MIPFFRKIRKKLADDNKPMKYMRYAIGEILLVVIGILIALQVNTWNEARKTRNKELNYLSNIKSDLQLNIAERVFMANFLPRTEAVCTSSFSSAVSLSILVTIMEFMVLGILKSSFVKFSLTYARDSLPRISKRVFPCKKVWNMTR